MFQLEKQLKNYMCVCVHPVSARKAIEKLCVCASSFSGQNLIFVFVCVCASSFSGQNLIFVFQIL